MCWPRPRSCCPEGLAAATALILCLAGQAVSSPSDGGSAPAAVLASLTQDDSTIELYAVILDHAVLSESIPAFASPTGLLFPLGELCRLFEVESGVDATTRVLHGRPPTGPVFLIDPGRLILRLGDRETPIDPARLRLAEGDIFLDRQLLSEILPVDLAVNANEATLTVTPRSPLPFQERMAREKRGDSLRHGDARGPTYPSLDIPYRFWSGPFVDPAAVVTFDPPTASGGRPVQVDYAAHIAGDLLWANFDGYVSGTADGLRDLRGTLARRDPGGSLLGPLHATEALVGNVFSLGMELVMAPASGTGAMVGSFALQRSAFFDRTALRGELPTGWSIELFLNGSLLEFQRSRPDGLYEFLDLPVYFGVNVYRLVFYGPAGQRREETKTFSATESQTPSRTFRYRAGALDPNRRLVHTLPPDSGSRAWVEGEYGLSKEVALSSGVARVNSVRGEESSYVTAGVRASIGRLFIRGDAALSQGGGRAVQAGLQTRLAGVGILVQHASLDHYETDWFRSIGTDLARRSFIRLDGALPKSFLPRLPVAVDIEQALRTDGSSILRMNTRISAYVRGVSASNSVVWTRASLRGSQSSFASGNLLLSRLRSNLVFRSGVSYTLLPARRIGGASLSAERKVRSGLRASVQISRTFGDSRTAIQAGLTRNEGRIAFGIQAQYSRPGGLRALAQVSLGVGRDDEGGWHASARQASSSGALVARTFLDANGNAVLDADEEPLDQVRFLVNGSRSKEATNERGSLFISGVPPNQATTLALAAETLADPFWKPAVEGVTIVPRPGRAPVINIPVLVTGEVTGTVFIERASGRQPAPGVVIELVDAAGKILKSATSSWDGYFTLADVPPGKAILRVGAAGLNRLGAVSSTSRPLEIGADGTVLDGLDLVISLPNAVL